MATSGSMSLSARRMFSGSVTPTSAEQPLLDKGRQRSDAAEPSSGGGSPFHASGGGSGGSSAQHAKPRAVPKLEVNFKNLSDGGSPIKSNLGDNASASKPKSVEPRVLQAFQRFDKSGDGAIDKFELEEALHELGLKTTPEQTMQVLKRYDRHLGDGKLDVTEFDALVKDQKLDLSEFDALVKDLVAADTRSEVDTFVDEEEFSREQLQMIKVRAAMGSCRHNALCSTHC